MSFRSEPVGSSSQTFFHDVAWRFCQRKTEVFAKKLLDMERRPDSNLEELSNQVQAFYKEMQQVIDQQFITRGATPDQVELLIDNTERALEARVFHALSSKIINEYEDSIMQLQKRIKSLNWITVENLEIDIDFHQPAVHDLLDKAICQIIELNPQTSSIDKLNCIVDCSKTIFELLKINQVNDQTVPLSADKFLPVLVFVVIQANPPMLRADVKYLSLFTNPNRLTNGETGYYFTNLSCAMEFIDRIQGSSLNLSDKEFDKYICGEAVPSSRSKFETYLSNGVRTMIANGASVKTMIARQETRQTKLDKLIEQIEVHLDVNRAKIEEVKKFALSLKQRLQPKLPDFYLRLLSKDKAYAIKLLPSYLKQDIELKVFNSSQL